MRIISLLPSATEIVFYLGLESHLVGRSHECDYPTSVKSLPICTSPKFNPDVSSQEIDQSVSALIQKGLSVYQVDGEQLEKLRPDFLITQSQCELCAVSLKDVEAAVCQLISSQPTIINLEPLGYHDIFQDILRAGETLGVTQAAQDLANQMQQKMDAIAQKTQDLPRKTVACIEWIEPLMYAANWTPTLIHKAGGQNLLGDEKAHSHYMQWMDIVAQNPDILLIMPCGFSIARTLEELDKLTTHPDWLKIPAVQRGDVYIADGNQYFNRPGPRIVDSVEIVAEILHPEHFSAQHHQSGWIKLEEVPTFPMVD